MTRTLSFTWIILAAALLAACGEHHEEAGPAGPTATATQAPTPTRPPLGGTQACDAGSDSCVHTHTQLFAVSHAFVDPENTVYYRVTAPAAPTGTDWGDGTNGFFYQAVVNGSTTSTYVPFNGIAVGDDNRPMLPRFSFIVAANVSAGEQNTTLEIALCASDYQVGASPTCTKQLWADTYTALPVPSVGPGPAGDPFNAFAPPNVLFTAETGSSVAVPNNGVYPGILEVCPTLNSSSCAAPGALSDVQLQWFYDHLLFFGLDGKPYTNDIFDDSSSEHRSMGVLTLEEAAFPISPTEYRTRYGSTTAIPARDLPVKQFFFYTKNPNPTATAITVGMQYLYDDTSCNGNLNSIGCGSSTTTGEVNILPAAAVTPEGELNGNVVAASTTDATAGALETRSVGFQVHGLNSICTDVVNPLAVNPGGALSGGSALQPNRPNYVIDDNQTAKQMWGKRFSPALYYVLPAGFGNCDAGEQPFCELTSGYAAYVPHYTPEGEQLNGGSTDEPFVDGFVLADQYQLPDLTNNSRNALVFFDNCGYGYTYDECSSGCTASSGTRKALPTPPTGFNTYHYTITNDRPEAVVFGKECCASWYASDEIQQGNVQVKVNEPQQQLDNGYGTFVPAGATRRYDTLFSDEDIDVYDAATGNVLHKLRLNATLAQLHNCPAGCKNAPAATGCPSTLIKSTGTNAYQVTLYDDDTGTVRCAPIGDCPFGMDAAPFGDGSTLAKYTACTAHDSNFIMAVQEWVAEQPFATDYLQVRAWGSWGSSGPRANGNNGEPGEGGFAMTVMPPSALPNDLYAYVGNLSNGVNDGPLQAGGSGSLLLPYPLSSLTAAFDLGAVTDPSLPGIEALVIAGGGGGGAQSSSSQAGGGGKQGGIAIANAPNLASAVNVSGAGNDGYGFECTGHGGGGNKDLKGEGGTGVVAAGTSGIGGVGGNNRWRYGSLVNDPGNFTQGRGGDFAGSAGGGGGGFGGGGSGQNCKDDYGGGGGSGGSWAAANTAYDPTFDIAGQFGSDKQFGAVMFVYLPANRPVLYRLNCGGPQLDATDGGPPWVPDDPFVQSSDSEVDTVSETIDLTNPSLTGVTCTAATGCGVLGGGAPAALFQSERHEPGTSMTYHFPVASGDEVEVRLLLAETYSQITRAGERTFNVKLEGKIPASFNTIDQFKIAGGRDRGVMLSATVVMADNTLDVEFDHIQEEPAIKGIEIRSLKKNAVGRGMLVSSTQPLHSDCLTLDDAGVILANQNHSLVWQSDGDLVLNNEQGLAVWRTGTDNGSHGGNGGARLCFQHDGNLVVYSAQGSALFASNTSDGAHKGKGGLRMILDDGCNLTITGFGDQSGNPLLFQTNTTCSSTPLPTSTPTPTPQNTPTMTGTPTVTPPPTHTATATRVPSDTATVTHTPTITETPSVTPTFTLTATGTPTATPAPSSTPTATPLPTDTPAPSATPTSTPTATATPHVVELLINELVSTNHPAPTDCLNLPGDDGVVLDNNVAQLVWQTDGDLVLRQGSTILWQSNTGDAALGGNGGRQLCFPNNLIIRNGAGTELFSTLTLQGRTLRLDASCNLAVLNLSGTIEFETSTTCVP